MTTRTTKEVITVERSITPKTHKTPFGNVTEQLLTYTVKDEDNNVLYQEKSTLDLAQKSTSAPHLFYEWLYKRENRCNVRQNRCKGIRIFGKLLGKLFYIKFKFQK